MTMIANPLILGRVAVVSQRVGTAALCQCGGAPRPGILAAGGAPQRLEQDAALLQITQDPFERRGEDVRVMVLQLDGKLAFAPSRKVRRSRKALPVSSRVQLSCRRSRGRFDRASSVQRLRGSYRRHHSRKPGGGCRSDCKPAPRSSLGCD